MCEFKVFIQRGRNGNKIADDIIRVFYENGNLILMDILGNKTPVKNVIITDINVGDEKIELLQQPIIGPIIRFLKKFFECQRKGVYITEVEEIWKEVKSRGDIMIRELKKNLEGPK